MINSCTTLDQFPQNRWIYSCESNERRKRNPTDFVGFRPMFSFDQLRSKLMFMDPTFHDPLTLNQNIRKTHTQP